MGKNKKYNYIMRVLIAFDQLGNAISGGDEDETISSRLGRWKLRTPNPKWYDPRHWLERSLHFIDENHAVDAIEWDRQCNGKDKDAS
jgi:hypothetical protein